MYLQRWDAVVHRSQRRAEAPQSACARVPHLQRHLHHRIRIPFPHLFSASCLTWQPFPQRLPGPFSTPHPGDWLYFNFFLVNYSLSSFSFLLLFPLPLLYCFTSNKAFWRKHRISKTYKQSRCVSPENDYTLYDTCDPGILLSNKKDLITNM